MVELLTVGLLRHNFRLYFLFKNPKVANVAENVDWSYVRAFKFSTAVINLAQMHFTSRWVQLWVTMWWGLVHASLRGSGGGASDLDTVMFFHLQMPLESLCGRPFYGFMHITSKPTIIPLRFHM